MRFLNNYGWVLLSVDGVFVAGVSAISSASNNNNVIQHIEDDVVLAPRVFTADKAIQIDAENRQNAGRTARMRNEKPSGSNPDSKGLSGSAASSATTAQQSSGNDANNAKNSNYAKNTNKKSITDRLLFRDPNKRGERRRSMYNAMSRVVGRIPIGNPMRLFRWGLKAVGSGNQYKMMMPGGMCLNVMKERGTSKEGDKAKNAGKVSDGQDKISEERRIMRSIISTDSDISTTYPGEDSDNATGSYLFAGSSAHDDQKQEQNANSISSEESAEEQQMLANMQAQASMSSTEENEMDDEDLDSKNSSSILQEEDDDFQVIDEFVAEEKLRMVDSASDTAAWVPDVDEDSNHIFANGCSCQGMGSASCAPTTAAVGTGTNKNSLARYIDPRDGGQYYKQWYQLYFTDSRLGSGGTFAAFLGEERITKNSKSNDSKLVVKFLDPLQNGVYLTQQHYLSFLEKTRPMPADLFLKFHIDGARRECMWAQAIRKKFRSDLRNANKRNKSASSGANGACGLAGQQQQPNSTNLVTGQQQEVSNKSVASFNRPELFMQCFFTNIKKSVELFPQPFRTHHLFTVVELGGAELADEKVQLAFRDSPSQMLTALGQMAEALAFLGHTRISHHDIQPRNILVDLQGLSESSAIDAKTTIVKMIDFGGMTHFDECPSDFTVTNFHVPPELEIDEMPVRDIQCGFHKRYPFSYDTFSMGAVFAFVLLDHNSLLRTKFTGSITTSSGRTVRRVDWRKFYSDEFLASSSSSSTTTTKNGSKNSSAGSKNNSAEALEAQSDAKFIKNLRALASELGGRHAVKKVDAALEVDFFARTLRKMLSSNVKMRNDAGFAMHGVLEAHNRKRLAASDSMNGNIIPGSSPASGEKRLLHIFQVSANSGNNTSTANDMTMVSENNDGSSDGSKRDIASSFIGGAIPTTTDNNSTSYIESKNDAANAIIDKAVVITLRRNSDTRDSHNSSNISSDMSSEDSEHQAGRVGDSVENSASRSENSYIKRRNIDGNSHSRNNRSILKASL